MMKKMLMPIFGLALLAAVNVEASRSRNNKCCDELRGVPGLALADFVNADRLGQFSSLPAFLSGSDFSVSPNSGCFRTQGVCLTIRDISLNSQVATSNCCPETGVFNSFVEVIAQFDVIFDKPFKSRPSVTANLEILTPMGVGCPFELGGTILCAPTAPPCVELGYVNDVLIFITDVTPNGFRLNFDAKLALANVALAIPVVQGLISRGLLFNFHAIATQNS